MNEYKQWPTDKIASTFMRCKEYLLPEAYRILKMMNQDTDLELMEKQKMVNRIADLTRTMAALQQEYKNRKNGNNRINH